ncbi:hypothetical protein [Streptomyces sp. UH6]|uniref:hypothetical protein n=1 Tax=Streptomyces sp. UH6 TaxID=2748379 RepID=UPI0015D488D5|nr:hypothetical protein [Streptomyces sp. UH6]NYV78106.1 hypothetical protein [Streptomyces sp. UH6]
MRHERTRWLPAVLASALLLPVPACSSGAAGCEEAFTAVTTSTPGVASAEFDCSDRFGGGWQRGDVVVEATTEAEAVTVMEAVLRAYAASPDIEDRWSTPQEYRNEDGSVVVGPGDLGFNGPPNVRQVREHFRVTPG